jgi:NadR type nicotinamide-nucleotide adenylyltransferase
MSPSKMIKVAVIGPECTGKSVLSASLAAHYGTVWVPEYARTYISELTRPYTFDDLTMIAHGQLALEDQYLANANRVLICDTNAYVVKVWSEFKYGKLDPAVASMIHDRHYDLYLLTYVDIPWEFDPQREHPTRREELYHIYLREMRQQHVPFVEIKGTAIQRKLAATQAIDQQLMIK